MSHMSRPLAVPYAPNMILAGGNAQATPGAKIVKYSVWIVEGCMYETNWYLLALIKKYQLKYRLCGCSVSIYKEK